MLRKNALWLFFVLLILAFGCDKLNLGPGASKKKQEANRAAAAIKVKGTLIAKVNNLPITLEELNKYISVYNASIDLREDLSPQQKTELKIDTQDQKLDYLKTVLVRQLIFYQGALDKGLERKEDIIEVLQKDKIAILAQEMQNEIVKDAQVSFAEIEEAYNRNKQLFREPETRRIMEIVTKTEDEAKQVLQELLQPGADFASVARSRSIAESAKKGGDLGYLQMGQRGEDYAVFDNVAFSPALQKGSLSSIFKGPGGYYIITVDSIKEGKQISLSEAQDTIKQIILAEKQREMLDKVYSQLSRDVKIEIYENQVK